MSRLTLYSYYRRCLTPISAPVQCIGMLMWAVMELPRSVNETVVMTASEG